MEKRALQLIYTEICSKMAKKKKKVTPAELCYWHGKSPEACMAPTQENNNKLLQCHSRERSDL